MASLSQPFSIFNCRDVRSQHAQPHPMVSRYLHKMLCEKARNQFTWVVYIYISQKYAFQKFHQPSPSITNSYIIYISPSPPQGPKPSPNCTPWRCLEIESPHTWPPRRRPTADRRRRPGGTRLQRPTSQSVVTDGLRVQQK